MATGSPFAPVKYDSAELAIAQCNNVYIFPAVGLGIVASRASRVTDSMLLAAAHALAESSPAWKVASAPLLPHLTDIRRVAAEMAFVIGLAAQQEDVAPQTTPEELRERVQQCQWVPDYSRISYPEMQAEEVLR